MHRPQNPGDDDPLETSDWIESLEGVISNKGTARAQFLLDRLIQAAAEKGVKAPMPLNTPYINTIATEDQPPYPGDQAIEWRIRCIVRWNAMAMVVRANEMSPGIGGHISTFASAATLYEVAFNHYLKGKEAEGGGDLVYFQGHASPGIYARSFLEGRFTQDQVLNFRREMASGGGLSSYPHPHLMPDYWEFPTVSMGLSPLMAIYQARFNRYLQARGILDTSQNHVWAFIGDGETDEPEALGSISMAGREKLDNLTFVINCNLQRLDGPVRGNGKIIQELEGVFRGAGWNVIKVIWGSDWDPLLKADPDGLLVKRMGEAVDGDYQKYSVEPGSYTRKHFFGKYPQLLKLVENLSDEQIQKLRRGGHEPDKVNAAYAAALAHKGQPTVILAKTIKGYGLGEAGEGRNMTHAQKKLNLKELQEFRDRFKIPIPDSQLAEVPFYRPEPKSPEMEYLMERRRELGGFLPKRTFKKKKLPIPKLDFFKEMLEGSSDREVATTMAFHRILALLLKDSNLGKRVVPIIPDEARTFGMDPLFRTIGIYSSLGQLYEPVDKSHLLYYRESKNGQLLEEGLTEAGSMSSFIAAGTSYASFSEPMIPFYIFYSMFGFQRTGDLMWACGDIKARGFLLGATAGRTTLMGEGLQHQDGHSHTLAGTIPNVKAYHPAFAYEIAVIIQVGLERMYGNGEDSFYYLTLQNETYVQPPMPEGVTEGIIKGLYPFRRAEKKGKKHVHLFGSSSILNEALRAQEILRDKFKISADVWSATSYQQLRVEALDTERWNRLHPEEKPRVPYVTKILSKETGPFVAAGDYLKSNAEQIVRWVPGDLLCLGTDGFGRSEDRSNLRKFFEVDAENIALGALYQLAQQGSISSQEVQKAIKDLGIDPEKPNPVIA